jgi:hypothetical protein
MASNQWGILRRYGMGYSLIKWAIIIGNKQPSRLTQVVSLSAVHERG